jgi:hypothetical protein
MCRAEAAFSPEPEGQEQISRLYSGVLHSRPPRRDMDYLSRQSQAACDLAAAPYWVRKYVVLHRTSYRTPPKLHRTLEMIVDGTAAAGRGVRHVMSESTPEWDRTGLGRGELRDGGTEGPREMERGR